MKTLNILVCDDDRAIADAIEIYLRHEGYEVVKAYNGKQALEALNNHEFHLVLMDVMMPEMDGLRATLKIREHANLPIIILSAKTEDTDKILGLNMGADDYVAKPFNPLELLARVKSQLRRYTTLGAMTEKSTAFVSGGLVLDDETKEVTLEGEPVKLTRYEYHIVRLLLSNAGKVFSSGQIYEQVWSEPPVNADNTVSVHIRRIREKIELNPKEPKYLKVVWGIGYKIEKLD